MLEELQAGQRSELLDSGKYSRITDDEMGSLMIQTSQKVAELLRMARTDPEQYREFTRRYNRMYCSGWER